MKSDTPLRCQRPGCGHPATAHKDGRCQYNDPVPFEYATLFSVPCDCTGLVTVEKCAHGFPLDQPCTKC